MNNMTKLFSTPYNPLKALVIYAEEGKDENYFVEAFDFNATHRMVNAHPLSVQEGRELSALLNTADKEDDKCFQSSGILPSNVLQVKYGSDGFVIWHTPQQNKNLYFIPGLGINNTRYPIPAMLWIAGKEKIQVFALKTNERPVATTQLFNAPFFNIHPEGVVCMGTVDVDIDNGTSLEEFMAAWEAYFFNSHFSHLLGDRSPVKSNILQLYQSLAGSRKRFPVSQLTKSNKQFKNILHAPF